MCVRMRALTPVCPHVCLYVRANVRVSMSSTLPVEDGDAARNHGHLEIEGFKVGKELF
jgi:hypothetical protein